MSENYLGEEIIPVKKTPFAHFGKAEWMMKFIEMYGGIDGSHHKNWVLDQCARIFHGGEIIVRLAKWRDGTENWRFHIDPTKEYFEWVREIKDGEDGPDTYGYDEGIAP